MRRFTLLVRGFGAAGAAANARAELEAVHVQHLQASLVVRRVHQRSGGSDVPLTSPAEARVA